MAKQVSVQISANAEELLNLAKLSSKKHLELGKDSPLNVLEWDKQAENVKLALDAHKQAKEYQRLAEQTHEKRDTLISPLDDLLKQTRDLLKALYRAEPKKLGEFGLWLMRQSERKNQKNKQPSNLQKGNKYKYNLLYLYLFCLWFKKYNKMFYICQ